jgi:hypothetical protein
VQERGVSSLGERYERGAILPCSPLIHARLGRSEPLSAVTVLSIGIEICSVFEQVTKWMLLVPESTTPSEMVDQNRDGYGNSVVNFVDFAILAQSWSQ